MIDQPEHEPGGVFNRFFQKQAIYNRFCGRKIENWQNRQKIIKNLFPDYTILAGQPSPVAENRFLMPRIKHDGFYRISMAGVYV
jgi:hypothetical protein